MLMNMIAGAFLVASLAQSTDTTFAVDPNARLELTNNEGSIVVRTWDRDEVSVSTNHSYGAVIEVRRTSQAIRIGVSRRYGDDDDDNVDYRLIVPASMALQLGGSETDVRVEGTRGEVNIDVADGNVTVWGGTGRVSIHTDDGDVYVEDVDGRIRLSSMDGDVTLEHAAGDIEVEASDGAITLLDIQAVTVNANTVDGDIWFDGVLASRGSYAFTTHDGDIEVHIPEGSDARVRMALRDGDFSSDFPVTLPRWPAGRRVEFNLGEGISELRMESFDGDIKLRRRGGNRGRTP